MKRYILVDASGKECGAGLCRTINPHFVLVTPDGSERHFKLWDLAKLLCPDVEDEDPTAVYWEGA
jgi:hypothetical protein